jgi:DNA polymerase-3 subunit beta
MKFTLPRETLLAPLQQVIGVIEKRQTLPILSNVLLKLADGRLEFTGTDLEVELVTAAAVDSGDSGRVTVPARKLLDIVRLLPDRSEIAVDCKEDRFALRCGSSRFSLSTLPADNYPEFDTGTADLSVDIPVASLRKALDKTTFAMALQDVRYYLNGLLLDLDGRILRAVASDGHRLAVYEEPLEWEAGAGRQIIVPRKGVLELARLLGDGEDAVTLEIAPNTARLRRGEVSFAVKLIEGRFPDYRRVMPRELPRVYQADKDSLKGALTRVSVLSSEKYKSISLDVNADSEMVLKAQNPEREEAEERLPVIREGGEIGVGFNAAYLLDAVNHVDSGQVKLSFPDAANACLIEDAEDSRFRFIVMPMRL